MKWFDEFNEVGKPIISRKLLKIEFYNELQKEFSQEWILTEVEENHQIKDSQLKYESQ